MDSALEDLAQKLQVLQKQTEHARSLVQDPHFIHRFDQHIETNNNLTALIRNLQSHDQMKANFNAAVARLSFTTRESSAKEIAMQEKVWPVILWSGLVLSFFVSIIVVFAVLAKGCTRATRAQRKNEENAIG